MPGLPRPRHVADAEFNAFQGKYRLLDHDTRQHRQVDVFLDRFKMCHEIPIRLPADERQETLWPAEL